VFGSYIDAIGLALDPPLGTPNCAALIPMVNAAMSSLPSSNQTPTYTDVQRIFNKSCIECHGGLGYPPYYAGGTFDLSEDENPPGIAGRMDRSHTKAMGVTTA